MVERLDFIPYWIAGLAPPGTLIWYKVFHWGKEFIIPAKIVEINSRGVASIENLTVQSVGFTPKRIALDEIYDFHLGRSVSLRYVVRHLNKYLESPKPYSDLLQYITEISALPADYVKKFLSVMETIRLLRINPQNRVVFLGNPTNISMQ